MIKNKRKAGGPSVLDNCIVKMQKGQKILYQHPLYSLGQLELKTSDLPDYTSAVYHDGSIQARFKSLKSAQKYVAFLKGEAGFNPDNRIDDEDRAELAAEALRSYSEAQGLKFSVEGRKRDLVGFLSDLRRYSDMMDLDFNGLVVESQRLFDKTHMA
jgi:hypothetical protein